MTTVVDYTVDTDDSSCETGGEHIADIPLLLTTKEYSYAYEFPKDEDLVSVEMEVTRVSEQSVARSNWLFAQPSAATRLVVVNAQDMCSHVRQYMATVRAGGEVSSAVIFAKEDRVRTAIAIGGPRVYSGVVVSVDDESKVNPVTRVREPYVSLALEETVVSDDGTVVYRSGDEIFPLVSDVSLRTCVGEPDRPETALGLSSTKGFSECEPVAVASTADVRIIDFNAEVQPNTRVALTACVTVSRSLGVLRSPAIRASIIPTENVADVQSEGSTERTEVLAQQLFSEEQSCQENVFTAFQAMVDHTAEHNSGYALVLEPLELDGPAVVDVVVRALPCPGEGLCSGHGMCVQKENEPAFCECAGGWKGDTCSEQVAFCSSGTATSVISVAGWPKVVAFDDGSGADVNYVPGSMCDWHIEVRPGPTRGTATTTRTLRTQLYVQPQFFDLAAGATLRFQSSSSDGSTSHGVYQFDSDHPLVPGSPVLVEADSIVASFTADSTGGAADGFNLALSALPAECNNAALDNDGLEVYYRDGVGYSDCSVAWVLSSGTAGSVAAGAVEVAEGKTQYISACVGLQGEPGELYHGASSIEMWVFEESLLDDFVAGTLDESAACMVKRDITETFCPPQDGKRAELGMELCKVSVDAGGGLKRFRAGARSPSDTSTSYGDGGGDAATFDPITVDLTWATVDCPVSSDGQECSGHGACYPEFGLLAAQAICVCTGRYTGPDCAEPPVGYCSGTQVVDAIGVEGPVVFSDGASEAGQYYAPQSDCKWTAEAGNDYGLLLRFTSVDTQLSADLVEVSRGVTQLVKVGVLDGRSRTSDYLTSRGVFLFPTDGFTVEFSSNDDAITGAGFSAEVYRFPLKCDVDVEPVAHLSGAHCDSAMFSGKGSESRVLSDLLTVLPAGKRTLLYVCHAAAPPFAIPEYDVTLVSQTNDAVPELACSVSSDAVCSGDMAEGLLCDADLRAHTDSVEMVPQVQHLGQVREPLRVNVAVEVAECPGVGTCGGHGECRTRRVESRFEAYCECSDGWVGSTCEVEPVTCPANENLIVEEAPKTMRDGSADGREYGPNSVCSWTLSAPQGRAVRIEFVRFDTEETWDILTVRDGGVNGPLLSEESGSLESGRVSAFLESATPTVALIFKSSPTNGDNGFELRYSSVEPKVVFGTWTLTPQSILASRTATVCAQCELTATATSAGGTCSLDIGATWIEVPRVDPLAGGSAGHDVADGAADVARVGEDCYEVSLPDDAPSEVEVSVEMAPSATVDETAIPGNSKRLFFLLDTAPPVITVVLDGSPVSPSYDDDAVLVMSCVDASQCCMQWGVHGIAQSQDDLRPVLSGDSFSLDDGEACFTDYIELEVELVAGVAATYSFTFTGHDDAGNEGVATEPFVWVADLEPPRTTFLEKPAPYSNSTTARFDLSCTEPMAACSFEYQLGSSWVRLQDPSDEAESEEVTDGELQSVVVLGTKLISMPPRFTRLDSATFEFEHVGEIADDDDDIGFEYRWTTPSSERTDDWLSVGDTASVTRPLAKRGWYTFGVRATADDGRLVDETPIDYAFFHESSPPTVDLLSRPPAITTQQQIHVVFAVREPGSVVEYCADVSGCGVELDGEGGVLDVPPSSWVPSEGPDFIETTVDQSTAVESHFILYRVTDAQGVVGAVEEPISFAVDKQAVTLQFTRGPTIDEPVLAGTSAAFSFTVAVPACAREFEWRLNSSSAWTRTSARHFVVEAGALGIGLHAVAARAVLCIDEPQFGHPVSRSFAVAARRFAQAPTVAIASAPEDGSKSALPRFSFVCVDCASVLHGARDPSLLMQYEYVVLPDRVNDVAVDHPGWSVTTASTKLGPFSAGNRTLFLRSRLLDGDVNAEPVLSPTVSYQWETRSSQTATSFELQELAPGRHQVAVVAKDDQGIREDPPTVVDFFVDTLSPVTDLAFAGSSEVGKEVTGNMAPVFRFADLSIDSRDDEEFTLHYRLRLAAAANVSEQVAQWQSVPLQHQAGGREHLVVLDLSVFDGKEHRDVSVDWYGVDGAGNEETPYRTLDAAFTVDYVAPSAVAHASDGSTGDIGTIGSNNVDILLECSDDDVTMPEPGLECSNCSYRIIGLRNGIDWQAAPGAIPIDDCVAQLQDLSDAAYTVHVYALDSVGNESPAPATLQFRVDVTAPQTYAPDPAMPLLSNFATADFVLLASETSTFEYNFSSSTGHQGAGTAGTDGNVRFDVSDGEYTVDAHAVDTGHNVDPTGITFQFVIDQLAPNATFNVEDTDGSRGYGVLLSCSKSECSYEVQVLGVGQTQAVDSAWEQVDGSVYQLTQQHFGAEGVYRFAARAMDPAGNIQEEPTIRSFVVDETPPSVVVQEWWGDGVTNGSIVFTNSSQSFIRFGVIDEDATPPVVVRVVKDGVPMTITATAGRIGNAATQILGESFPISVASPGAHSLSFRSQDSVGNVEETQHSLSWILDIAAPALNITQQPDSSWRSNTSAFTLLCSDEYTCRARVRVSVLELDPGLDNECEADALAASLTVVDRVTSRHVPASEWLTLAHHDPMVAIPVELSLKTRTSSEMRDAEGTFEATFVPFDDAGNAGAVQVYRWIIDHTPPGVEFTRVPETSLNVNPVVEVTATADFRELDAVRFHYALVPMGDSSAEDAAAYWPRTEEWHKFPSDDSVWEAWRRTAPTDMSRVFEIPRVTSSGEPLLQDLSEQRYLILAQVEDPAGNIGPPGGPVRLTWTVSSSKPTVEPVRVPADVIGTSVAHVTFAARADVPIDSPKLQNPVFYYQLVDDGGESEPWARLPCTGDPTEPYDVRYIELQTWQQAAEPAAANSFTCSHSFPLPLDGTYILKVKVRTTDAFDSHEAAGELQQFTWKYEFCDDVATYAQINATSGALVCDACPAGADCSGRATTVLSLRAQPNYWVSGSIEDSEPTFHQCPFEEACVGGTEDNGTIPAACAEGYTGVLCAICDEGYYVTFGACERCPETKE